MTLRKKKKNNSVRWYEWSITKSTGEELLGETVIISVTILS